MSNLKIRKYINFTYYKNFEDYEKKYRIENKKIIREKRYRDQPNYYINLAKEYLYLGYGVTFKEISNSIIYEKANNSYTDSNILDTLFIMNLIPFFIISSFMKNAPIQCLLSNNTWFK